VSWWLLVGVALAAEGPWAGVPLERLAELGVGEPTLDVGHSAWRAPLEAGGFVEVSLYQTPDRAAAAAAWLQVASAQRSLTALGPDHWGDDAGMALLRDGNVVILVRSASGQAGGVATALQGALVVEPPPGDWQRLVVDGVEVAWDACGRRRVVE